MTLAYQPRSIKRKRRSRSEIEFIDNALYDVLAASESAMTCRQVFYQLTKNQTIEKTENEYHNTVIRRLGILRKAGTIPFDWISDNTRWMRKPRTWGGMKSAVRRTAESYRRAMWDNQNCYVEIWIEKDALAGVVYDITAEFDVPLMVAKGFSSITYLYSAAENIAAQEKPAHIYAFTDHDPAGVWIPRKIEQAMREWAPDAEIHFTRAAVTQEQIDELELPTRPTKTTDSRAKNFKGESVDLDAMAPADLRQLVTNCIRQHIDPWQWSQTEMIEAEERSALEMLADRFEGGTQ